MRQIVQRKEFPFVLRLSLGKFPRTVEGHSETISVLPVQLPRLTRQRLRGPRKGLVLHLLDQRLGSLAPVYLHSVWRNKLDSDYPLGQVRPKEHGVVFDN